MIELLKILIDDFARQRWGDIVALFLILLGVWLIMHGMDETVKDTGKGLVAAGLFALRPKSMNAANGADAGK